MKNIIIKFLLIICFIGCIYYLISTKEERQIKNEYNSFINSSHVSLINTRVHGDSTYYYFLCKENISDIPENFYSKFYEHNKINNPIIFILNDSAVRLNFIDLYYSIGNEIPKACIIEAAESLEAVYNLNQSQELITFPLKKLDLYNSVVNENKEAAELEKQKAIEIAERFNKARNEHYIHSFAQQEKWNGKTVTVKYVFAYCTSRIDASELLSIIRDGENNKYLYIYIFDKSFSKTELEKGQSIDQINHTIAKWSFRDYL